MFALKPSNGCKKACLYTAGHGAFDNVKQGRINKTRWYIQERETFLDKIRKEIKSFIAKAKERDLIPCIRLNGTSIYHGKIRALMKNLKILLFMIIQKSIKEHYLI